MNNLIRSSVRCLRLGAAGRPSVRLPAGPASFTAARLLCAATDMQQTLGEMVKKDKVVVFIKGTPAQPMCGFSNAVVQILRMHGVDDYAAYNVLDDQDLRQGQWSGDCTGSTRTSLVLMDRAVWVDQDLRQGRWSGDWS